MFAPPSRRPTRSARRACGRPGSCHVAGETSLPIIAVGDAASCFDPISGQGIVKALRSGVFASYAAADFLCRGDDTGLARYRSLTVREFAAYRQTLADYYAPERRWAERPFWQGRQQGSVAATKFPPLAVSEQILGLSRLC